MAEVVDSCCVPSAMAVQLTKPDKNNNTTANVDDDISLPSEQCDGVDEKSDSTGDTDDHRLSSGVDDDGNTTIIDHDPIATGATSLSTDDLEVPLVGEPTANNLHPNTSTTNHVSNTDPYKDFSGVDTESFISTTLRNNPKDRTLLLTLETVLRQFVQDDEQTSHQFQAMNSYERMIVHRVAAFFGLDHNVDKNGQAVVVTKTSNTRIPEFSFQKCIPEDEAADSITAASAIESNTLASSAAAAGTFNSVEVPTRRILRRHEKSSNHDHLSRNGLGDDPTNPLHSSSAKHQPLAKPYLERVNNYAETRARIFNEASNANTDLSNAPMTNKPGKVNPKPNSYAARPPYRKQQQNSAYQNRAYVYPHAQATSNTHQQQYGTGKNIDPSSHMLNPSTTRTASMYPAHPMAAANLNMAQPPIYASMVAANPGGPSIRAPVAASFYAQSPQPPQQQSVDYDYKQQIGGPHIYNYVPMITQTGPNFIHHQQQQQPPTAQQQQQVQALHSQSMPTGTTSNPNQVPSQHGANMQMPILVHQQPTGQIQYLFPAQALQHQQQHGPSNPNSYSMTADGQYLQIYRPDGLPVTGAVSSVMDGAGGHHHAHHHPYPPNASYHQHPHHHAISQQQQVPPTQSNPAQQAQALVRLYQTAAPGNVSHPYAQAPYPSAAPPATFVQPGSMPQGSFMVQPPQNSGGVPTYTTFDNGASYAAYGQAAASSAAGKPNMSNNNGTGVQYATNHLSTLTLQNQHDEYQARLLNNPQTRFTHANGSSANHHHHQQQQQQQQQRNFMGRPLVQSPNGSANPPRMTMYPTSNHAYRPTRPYNPANTDKQIPASENDPKSLSNTQQSNNITMGNSSDPIALAGPAQSKE